MINEEHKKQFAGIEELDGRVDKLDTHLNAMEVLRTRLYDLNRCSLETERADSRRKQVGTGDRSERIRTYNFPQGRITDHRINHTIYKLEQFLGGELDEMINKLIADDQAQQIAEFDDS